MFRKAQVRNKCRRDVVTHKMKSFMFMAVTVLYPRFTSNNDGGAGVSKETVARVPATLTQWAKKVDAAPWWTWSTEGVPSRMENQVHIVEGEARGSVPVFENESYERKASRFRRMSRLCCIDWWFSLIHKSNGEEHVVYLGSHPAGRTHFRSMQASEWTSSTRARHTPQYTSTSGRRRERKDGCGSSRWTFDWNAWLSLCSYIYIHPSSPSLEEKGQTRLKRQKAVAVIVDQLRLQQEGKPYSYPLSLSLSLSLPLSPNSPIHIKIQSAPSLFPYLVPSKQ